MGPILIFDKSFLQGLNVDESVWLGAFFNTNMIPPFFIETLADLEKTSIRSGRSPEEIVGNLADKTPSFSSKANVHHRGLLEEELLSDYFVQMGYGIPIIGQPKYIELEGKRGAIVTQTREENALQRWQNREFLELERNFAKQWRLGLSALKLDDAYRAFRKYLEPIGIPKTFEQVTAYVNSILNSREEANVAFTLVMLEISEGDKKVVLTRWREAGQQPFRKFAPYAAHVASVELFFYFAMGSNLIAHERPSHKVDFSYLYYLPFRNVFTSDDKLHREIAPLFMGSYQEFVGAKDLKNAFGKLDTYYSSLPASVLTQGVMGFAQYPPTDVPSIVNDLWDKYCPLWRKQHNNLLAHGPREPVQDANLANDLVRFAKGPEMANPMPVTDPLDYVVLKRMVPIKQGKWRLLPPDVS